jgi:hypothetical protein
MALVASFVKETANAPGTSSTFNLGGADAPFVTFVAAGQTGSGHGVVMEDGAQWQEVSATITAGTPDTCTIDAVIANSAGTTEKLNFTSSDTRVYNRILASRSVGIDDDGTVDVGSADITTTGDATVGSLDAGSGDIKTTGSVKAKDGLFTGGVSATGNVSSTSDVTASGNVKSATQASSSTDCVVYSQLASSSASGEKTVQFPDGTRIKGGSKVVTLNSSGQGTVAFSTAFTATPITVIAINGDVNANVGQPGLPSTLSASGFNFQVSGLGAVTYRINYWAIA